MTDLNRLFQRLCDAEIEFIIVGGFAAMLHGSTLLTRDLDVCAVLSSANVEKLRDILRDLHPSIARLSFLDNPSPGVPVQNLYLETELGSLDILTSILGVGDFERVRTSSIEIDLKTEPVTTSDPLNDGKDLYIFSAGEWRGPGCFTRARIVTAGTRQSAQPTSRAQGRLLIRFEADIRACRAAPIRILPSCQLKTRNI